MYRFTVGGVIASLLLYSGMSLNAMPQQTKEIPPTSTVPLPSYPESPDGLKKLIEDIFGAIKSGNNEQVSSYFSSLTMPGHSAWFVKTFGSAEGPRLEAKYEELLPQASGITQKRPMRVTSKPANDKARDIDSDGSLYRLRRHEQCLERRKETTSHRTREARMALAAHRASHWCAS